MQNNAVAIRPFGNKISQSSLKNYSQQSEGDCFAVQPSFCAVYTTFEFRITLHKIGMNDLSVSIFMALIHSELLENLNC